MMTDLEMWALLVGTLLPPLVAIVNQSTWSPAAKFITTVIISILAGGATAYFSGDLTGRRWLSAALVVGVAALLTYQTGWKPSTIAPAIERATTIGGGGGTHER